MQEYQINKVTLFKKSMYLQSYISVCATEIYECFLYSATSFIIVLNLQLYVLTSSICPWYTYFVPLIATAFVSVPEKFK
jgi:hypothetical protein